MQHAALAIMGWEWVVKCPGHRAAILRPKRLFGNCTRAQFPPLCEPGGPNSHTQDACSLLVVAPVAGAGGELTSLVVGRRSTLAV